MYKEVLNHADMTHWAEMGLVIFFAVFLFTTVWAMTRSRKQVSEWSAIPLGGSGDGERMLSRGEGESHV